MILKRIFIVLDIHQFMKQSCTEIIFSKKILTNRLINRKRMEIIYQIISYKSHKNICIFSQQLENQNLIIQYYHLNLKKIQSYQNSHSYKIIIIGEGVQMIQIISEFFLNYQFSNKPRNEAK
ncbi:unnamed protein product [Paramecium sonneborni]|uniref:Uncharacterized protein n=1 Tax=Paramecium sonneborni TaxID=65129 RepID=A0A8S1QR01_9CILI|nr:unnamed protein product [Paramecium sonneborni]